MSPPGARQPAGPPCDHGGDPAATQEAQQMGGSADQWLVGGRSVEQSWPVPTQPQRTTGHPELLLAELPCPGRVRHGCVEARQRGCASRVVDGPAVVRIHQGRLRQFAALVAVWDAGQGELDQLRRQGGGAGGIGVRGDDGADGVGDRTGETLAGQCQNALLISLVGIVPGGVLFGLAHCLQQVVRESFGVQRPGAQQGLREEVAGGLVDVVNGGRSPYRRPDVVPAVEVLRGGQQARAGVLVALGVVGRQCCHAVGMVGGLVQCPAVQGVWAGESSVSGSPPTSLSATIRCHL